MSSANNNSRSDSTQEKDSLDRSAACSDSILFLPKSPKIYIKIYQNISKYIKIYQRPSKTIKDQKIGADWLQNHEKGSCQVAWSPSFSA